jgi:hypothetical protein
MVQDTTEGPAAVTAFLPMRLPGEVLLGSVRFDPATLQRTIGACSAADAPGGKRHELTDASLAVRVLDLSALPSAARDPWEVAAQRQRVRLVHPDADPTVGGAPVKVVRVLADCDGIQVAIGVAGEEFCSLVLDVPYLMALEVLMSEPGPQLVDRLLRLDKTDSDLAAACLGEEHPSFLGIGATLTAALSDDLRASLLFKGSAGIRRRAMLTLSDREGPVALSRRRHGPPHAAPADE